jgi:hypothetical protein
MTTPTPSTGFITVAMGSRSWLEPAIDCALSLKAHHDLPVALATNASLAKDAEQLVPHVFDAVCVLPADTPVEAAKFYLDGVTPYEHSLYLDADSIALGPIDACFAPLKEHRVVLVAEWKTLATKDVLHQGRSVHGIIRTLGMDSYLKCNGGLFAFRKTGTEAIFADFREVQEKVSPRFVYPFLRPFKKPGDEIAFGIVGARHAFGTFDAFQPMMWGHELRVLKLSAPRGPLLHQIGPIPDAALNELMEILRERRARVGLTFASESWWRNRNAMLLWRNRVGTPLWLEMIFRADSVQSLLAKRS